MGVRGPSLSFLSLWKRLPNTPCRGGFQVNSVLIGLMKHKQASKERGDARKGPRSF